MSEVERFGEKHERLAAGPRLGLLDQLLVEIEAAAPDEAEGALRRMSRLIVQAILDGDESVLQTGLSGLQRLYAIRLQSHAGPSAEAGRLQTLADPAYWGLEMIPSLSLLAELEGESHAHTALKAIDENPGATNIMLADYLGVGETQVSRLGRRLQQLDLARKRKIGRTNSWHLTPRGVQMLGLLESEGAARPRPTYRQFAY